MVPPDVPIPPTPSPEFLGAALATTGERDGRAVLIVDDNPAARGMMRVALEKSGYRVFEAGDGQTAIALLARHRPALVLQDLHLPDVDGVALVSQLRAVPAGEDIPILAFSGLMSKVQRARALRAGFTDYIFKPVEPSDLVGMVDSYLATPAVVGEQPGRGHRVLLVDDDPLQGKLSARQLTECGFAVELMSNGVAALAAAKLHQPDAIVVDLLMPGMNGMEVCLAVRRDAQLAQIPVVITSSTFAIIEDVDRRLAIEIGADAFVERTPSCMEVIEKVVAALANVRPHAPGPDADTMSSEFIQRQMRELKHQASINASLMRQGAMNSALLSILAGATEILTGDHDLPTLLHSVLARALEAGGVSAGAIFLVDEQRPLSLSAQVGFPDASLDAVGDFFGEQELLRTLALGHRAVEIPSPAVDAAVAQALLIRAEASALIVAPLLTAGVSHGALVLRANARDLGEGFLASVTGVASQLGQAVALSQTVERLRVSEARYRSLFEGIPTGVFRSEFSGRLLDVNHELARILGAADRTSLLGTSALTLYARPEDRAAWQAILVQDGEVRDFETQMRRVDGTAVWVAVSARAIYGPGDEIRCYEGTITDITRRKVAEAELQAAQSRLRQVLRSTDVVIYLLRLTPEGMEPEWVSENMARITGHEGEHVMRFEWWLDHVHPDDREGVVAATSALSGPGQATHEYRFRQAQGSYMWLRDSQRLLRDKAGRPTHVVGALADITEQKSLQAQLFQAQKMEAIGQLAAGVAHDFNNILTVISGFAELLGDELPVSDHRRTNVTEIVRAANQAGVLTRQLLAFGRRQVLHPAVFDLNEAITSAQSMLERLIGEHIDVQSVLSPEPLPVRLDPGQLEQVVLNLAVNARDAMERGGTLTIETRRIELSANDAEAHALSHSGAYAVLLVSDTGVGMSAEVQAHAFEPFFTTKERGKGTGLGLATVYGIVKQSGGNVLVYSEPGVGTTFKLYFPLTAERPSSDERSTASAPPVGRGEVILLVEDQDAVRRFATDVLVHHGYRVLDASNADEALRHAASDSQQIDLLLTDVIMPGMTGPELSDRLRGARPNLPVIFMSGYAGDAVVRHGVPALGFHFLDKPFSATRLLEIIGSVLSTRSR